ncbi:MAG TPA: hypothetical protein VMY98_01165 [Anaerolineae bacterium]|nr:hypothetical protein [Anaerolineae bacterium]
MSPYCSEMIKTIVGLLNDGNTDGAIHLLNKLDDYIGNIADWSQELNPRQAGLVRHCLTYEKEGAHGLPGHQLMLIVATLVKRIGSLLL